MTTQTFYSEFEADRAIVAECECCNGAFSEWSTHLVIIKKVSTIVVAHFCPTCIGASGELFQDAEVTFIKK